MKSILLLLLCPLLAYGQLYNSPAFKGAAAMKPVAGGGGTLTAITSSTDAGPSGLAPRAWMGFAFTNGPNSITVKSLGRWVESGNSEIHHLSMFSWVDTVQSHSVQLADVTLDTSLATVGQYNYVSISTNLTLAANTAYILVSSESGSDATTMITLITMSSDFVGVWEPIFQNGTDWATFGGDISYSKLNFQYTQP